LPDLTWQPRVQVNVPEGKLVLSERAAMTTQLASQLKAGDVVEGIVTRLVDYGAFVSLRSPDGQMHGIEVGTKGFCRMRVDFRSAFYSSGLGGLGSWWYSGNPDVSKSMVWLTGLLHFMVTVPLYCRMKRKTYILLSNL
jgi:hypothetical protein